MPRTVNPIKKAKVKASLLKGNSARQALKDANYGRGHIRRSTTNKIVRDSINEILQEFKESDLTVQLVLKNLFQDRQLALNKNDLSNVVRVDELLGKYLSMFTDKIEQKVKSSLTIEQRTQLRNEILQELTQSN